MKLSSPHRNRIDLHCVDKDGRCQLAALRFESEASPSRRYHYKREERSVRVRIQSNFGKNLRLDIAVVHGSRFLRRHVIGRGLIPRARS
jgi:hypothetical protein